LPSAILFKGEFSNHYKIEIDNFPSNLIKNRTVPKLLYGSPKPE